MAQSSYSLTISNDGSGNYTATAQRGGTPASGGTNLPGGGGDLLSANVFADLKTVTYHALVVIADDRAAGN